MVKLVSILPAFLLVKVFDSLKSKFLDQEIEWVAVGKDPKELKGIRLIMVEEDEK